MQLEKFLVVTNLFTLDVIQAHHHLMHVHPSYPGTTCGDQVRRTLVSPPMKTGGKPMHCLLEDIEILRAMFMAK